MTRGSDGVWSRTVRAALKDLFYQYEVEVYVPSTGQVEHNFVTDPYSISLSQDSTRSQIVDLNDPLTKPTFEHWQKTVLENPNLLPDAWFIALDGDRYVGESTLLKSRADPNVLYTGATGILREYRRRGIALALKLRAIRYAKSVSCPQIRTWNETNNRAMLSINEALGFVKQPAWISFAKTLKEEEEAGQ